MKRILCSLSLLTALASAVAADESTVLNMHFTCSYGDRPAPATNAVNGKTALIVSNTFPLAADAALDSSSYANHGTAANGARWIRDGAWGGAYEFDGVDDCILVPDATNLSFRGATSDVPFSVCAWVRSKSGRDFPILARGEPAAWSFGLDSSGRLSFRVFTEGDAPNTWASRDDVQGDAGAWHCYAVVYDGRAASNSVTIYRDGGERPCASQGPLAPRPMRGSTGRLSIGRGDGRYACGSIDEVRVDRSALSSNAVSALALFPAEHPEKDSLQVIEAPVQFPQESRVFMLRQPSGPSWLQAGSIELDLYWPPEGNTNTEVLVYVQDWDWYWYQLLLPRKLTAGSVNHLTVDLAPDAEGWEPREHYGPWHYRALAAPKEIGVRVFSKGTWRGAFKLDNVAAVARPKDTEAPFIRNVQANRDQVLCFRKFEVTCDLPDRYGDPFSTNEVAVTATFEGPSGPPQTVGGFYTRTYFREVGLGSERIVPQGKPLWCVRFAPSRPGKYTYTLTARDAYGETRWGPAGFTALPPLSHGFVRVAASDPRFFEFTDGTPYFPIGHNARSPFDTRLDQQFPWTRRSPEGSTVYARYFGNMQKNGETWAEIWTAAWSLGLEWNDQWAGYHGIGQYNLTHAWELDQVLDDAERHGIHVNLVVHNHGQFGTFLDNEWVSNPFNKANGGYLTSPEEYFSDPRAKEDFLKLMRYMIARWGYSTSVFAWELWSELDLTGTGFESYRKPPVLQWHREMGAAVKAMDPYSHMVSSHVSGDYNKQHPDVMRLPEMDLCPVDAYYYSTSPLQIISLLESTANYNNPVGKPVLVTEFGGSHIAASLKHLSDSLHAALWSSVCIPLGGTPMFWWWGLVEEENLYPAFRSLADFMQGEDPRGRQRLMYIPSLAGADAAPSELLVRCLKDGRDGYGWIYDSKRFSEIDPEGPATVTNLSMSLGQMSNGAVRVEFWDTVKGTPVKTVPAVVSNETVTVVVPPFARDIAFKIKRPGAGAPKE